MDKEETKKSNRPGSGLSDDAALDREDVLRLGDLTRPMITEPVCVTAGKDRGKLKAIWLCTGISTIIVVIAGVLLAQPREGVVMHNTAQWQGLDQAGQESFDKGKLSEAEKQFDAALKLAQSSRDKELEIASFNELLDLESAKGDLKRRQVLLADLAESLKETEKIASDLLSGIEEMTSEVAAGKVDSSEIAGLCEKANEEAANKLKLGDIKTARLLVTKTKVLAERALPPDSPIVGRCLHILGAVHQDEGDFTGAILCFKKALEFHGKSGILSPMMAQAYYELALAYLYSNDASLAEKNMMVAMQMFRQAVGPRSHEVAYCKAQLAVIFEAQGIKERSIETAKSAIGILEGEAPAAPDELALARAYGILARANQDPGASQRALNLCEHQVTKPYPLLCEALLNAGELYASSSLDHAQALLNRSNAISERFANDRTNLIDVDLLYLQGRIHLLKNELGGAKAAFDRALIARRKYYGADSPPCADVLTNIAVVNSIGGKSKAAEKSFEEAAAILARCSKKAAGYSEASDFLRKEYADWLSKAGRDVDSEKIRRVVKWSRLYNDSKDAEG